MPHIDRMKDNAFSLINFPDKTRDAIMMLIGVPVRPKELVWTRLEVVGRFGLLSRLNFIGTIIGGEFIERPQESGRFKIEVEIEVRVENTRFLPEKMTITVNSSGAFLSFFGERAWLPIAIYFQEEESSRLKTGQFDVH